MVSAVVVPELLTVAAFAWRVAARDFVRVDDSFGLQVDVAARFLPQYGRNLVENQGQQTLPINAAQC